MDSYKEKFTIRWYKYYSTPLATVFAFLFTYILIEGDFSRDPEDFQLIKGNLKGELNYKVLSNKKQTESINFKLTNSELKFIIREAELRSFDFHNMMDNLNPGDELELIIRKPDNYFIHERFNSSREIVDVFGLKSGNMSYFDTTRDGPRLSADLILLILTGFMSLALIYDKRRWNKKKLIKNKRH